MSYELPSPTWDGIVKTRSLEEYSERYKSAFTFDRRNGIIQVQMQTDGGPPAFNFAMHNNWTQVWQDIGNDPENEVMILTSTGEIWTAPDAHHFERKPTDWSAPEKVRLFIDAVKIVENMVSAIEIPTIGAINGSGTHQEIALLCDITLCTEETTFFDPHFLVGVPPGDGLALTFQELIGSKRANYYMYSSQPFSAHQALEWGLVNEVVPRDQLLPRAREIAEMIMRRPLAARRFTSLIAKRVWRRRLQDDQVFQLALELLSGEIDRPFDVQEGDKIVPLDGNVEDFPFNYTEYSKD